MVPRLRFGLGSGACLVIIAAFSFRVRLAESTTVSTSNRGAEQREWPSTKAGLSVRGAETKEPRWAGRIEEDQVESIPLREELDPAICGSSAAFVRSRSTLERWNLREESYPHVSVGHEPIGNPLWPWPPSLSFSRRQCSKSADRPPLAKPVPPLANSLASHSHFLFEPGMSPA
jgi:hypothetical protein